MWKRLCGEELRMPVDSQSQVPDFSVHEPLGDSRCHPPGLLAEAQGTEEQRQAIPTMLCPDFWTP